MSERWLRLGVVLSVVAAVGFAVACGGGGGGSSGPAATTEVTTDNQNEVVGAVNGGTGALITSGAEIPVSKPGAPSSGGTGLANLATGLVTHVCKGEDASGDVVALAVAEEVVDYPGGGWVTVTVNDADNSDTVSRGDSITADFDNCIDGDTTIDGMLEIVLNALAVNQAAGYLYFSATVTATDLFVTESGVARELDGAYTVTVEVDGNSVTGQLYGSSVTVVEAGVTWTLSCFAVTYWTNTQTTNYNYASSGGLTSDAIGGTVVFQTPTIFQGTGNQYPNTGVMKIFGSGGTSLTVTAVDATNVRLELDGDGDGVAETTTDTTWAVLLE
jgi:hypothetical protein